MRTTCSGPRKRVYRKFPIKPKRLTLVALTVLILAFVAASAKADPMDGIWKSQRSGRGVGFSGTFTLKRNGDQVTGTHIDSRGASWEIRGKIYKLKQDPRYNDTSYFASFSWNESGGGAIVVYSAVVSGDSMDVELTSGNGVEALHLRTTAHRVSH